MGRGRRFDKKTRVRPKKYGCERNRREKVHRKRLVSLGMPEAVANALNPKVVREILARPLEVDRAIKIYTTGKTKKRK